MIVSADGRDSLTVVSPCVDGGVLEGVVVLVG